MHERSLRGSVRCMRAVLLVAVSVFACKPADKATVPAAPEDPTRPPEDPPQIPIDAAAPAPAPPPQSYDQLSRTDFNRFAVRANLPLYWIEDRNGNKVLEPSEFAGLLFYPKSGTAWTAGNGFTADFDRAYAEVVLASKVHPPPVVNDEVKRIQLVNQDLDQGRASIVLTDFTGLSAADKKFAGHMMRVGTLVDQMYDKMTGAAALAAKLPADAASQSLFRRNRGSKCVAPATERDPLCSAIPGSPKPVFSLYPPDLQTQPNFCDALAKAAKESVRAPFTVVGGAPGQNFGVPYNSDLVYGKEMAAIARELTVAADSIKDPSEAALVAYLRAAATSFTTNQWEPADEAWAKMTVDNSKWYVRVAPDEVYWEPCSLKAGVHLTFARINQGSRAWQAKLVPVQQEMEAAIAKRVGPNSPYKERKVTFHLPDFIDIVVNAGDDRDPLGATIGQSLPNWGPVANEGRGRTVAMVNLYTDPDSRAARRAQAESMLTAASMKHYSDSGEPSLLSTILHEATHNLGPAHEYKVGGKTASQIFTGPVASTLEELKAQTGALFLLEMLRGKKLISDELAIQTYVDGIVWAMGHISTGMYDADKKPKPYSQLAAIQVGFLIENGVLVWDAKATAANGKDTGAFTIHLDKIVKVADEMMKHTGGIKARGDKAAALKLVEKYVDGKVVPHAVITERYLRFPKASFVYSVAM